jgi:fatty-acyl-CoA synthase
MSGSTCPLEIVQETIKKLNVKEIVVGYGLTETAPVITISSVHDSLENRTQTIGKPMGHLEVKVVDKDGQIIPYNETGELLIRGYSTMIGLLNQISLNIIIIFYCDN